MIVGGKLMNRSALDRLRGIGRDDGKQTSLAGDLEAARFLSDPEAENEETTANDNCCQSTLRETRVRGRFEKVFRERAGLVDKMEGFISNQICP